MSIPILVTKLNIPQRRGRQVSRGELVERININLERKLTLVSAPAGFGKTTLICEWCQRTDRAVAWLSLDDGDNEMVRYLSYLIVSLKRVEEKFGDELLEMLGETKEPPVEKLLVPLLNEIDQKLPPTVLVLDDYHLIHDREIHDIMEFLLENLPAQLHVILSTRADPPWSIARMRVQGQLAEIRVDELRFSQLEANEFINRVMELELSEEQLSKLDDRIEGWVAGLQMAALSMRGRTDIDSFIDSFAGSNRFILDYLVEEVLSSQSDTIQGFLLRTSILDRLSGPLCDAVRLQNDSQEILNGLDQANVFLFPMDDRRGWFRYHHLFSELLQSRLRLFLADEIPGMHLKASQWFEGAGFLEEAIDHAAAAGDLERIADLVENNAMQMFTQSRLGTLSRWMEMLPEVLIRSRPWLCIYHAWTLYWIGKRDQVEECLLHAEESLSSHSGSAEYTKWASLQDETRDHITGYIAALRAYNTLRDMPYAIRMAQKAIKYLPPEDYMLATTEITIGGTNWAQGKVVEAEAAFGRARELALESGFQAIAVSATCYEGTQQVKQGDLKRALNTFQQAEALASLPDGRKLLAAGLAEIKIGKLHLEWNHLTEAEQYLENGVRRLDRLANIDFLVEGLVWSAELKLAQQDLDGAVEYLRRAQGLVAESEIDPWVETWLNDCHVKTLIRAGNLREAVERVESVGLEPDGELDYLYDLDHIILARALYAQGVDNGRRDTIHQAQELLDRLLVAAEKAGWTNEVIRIEVLRALSAQWMNMKSEAISALMNALKLAEPGGYVRVFIGENKPMSNLLRTVRDTGAKKDTIDKLLCEMDREQLIPSPILVRKSTANIPGRLVEPLSEREMDVLRLLRTELTVPEIADELFIAPSTVRTHIKNIYGKLDAHNRMEAIRKATELDLI